MAGAASTSECYCTARSYLDATSSVCVDCPGLQTCSQGATSVSECDFCNAGSYLDVTSSLSTPSLCVACPAGFLKDVVEDAACTPCPGGNTSLAGATSALECYCDAGSYLDATSSLCVDCPEGGHSPLGATSVSECYCAAGVFTNCALNGLVVKHAPHSVYVGEAWDGSTLPDLSGNARHAVLTVVPLYWQTLQALGG